MIVRLLRAYVHLAGKEGAGGSHRGAAAGFRPTLPLGHSRQSKWKNRLGGRLVCRRDSLSHSDLQLFCGIRAASSRGVCCYPVPHASAL